MVLSGDIDTQRGGPLPWIEVELRSSGVAVASATTGADGRYELTVPPSDYELVVRNGGNFLMPVFELTTGGPTFPVRADRQLDLTLPTGVHRLSTVDRLGEPVGVASIEYVGGPDVPVDLEVAPGLRLGGSFRLSSGGTTAQGGGGRFVLPTAGPVDLRFRPWPSSPLAPVTVGIALAPGGRSTVELGPAELATITGTVRNPGGGTALRRIGRIAQRRRRPRGVRRPVRLVRVHRARRRLPADDLRRLQPVRAGLRARDDAGRAAWSSKEIARST